MLDSGQIAMGPDMAAGEITRTKAGKNLAVISGTGGKIREMISGRRGMRDLIMEVTEILMIGLIIGMEGQMAVITTEEEMMMVEIQEIRMVETGNPEVISVAEIKVREALVLH